MLSGAGAGRDAVVAALAESLTPGAPVRRLPPHADDDRLIGGLDLGAALAGQGARLRRGLLAEADGGLLIVPMAERLSPALAARLGLERQWLHAVRLAFEHPTGGGWVEFASPYPQDLATALDRLREPYR